MPLPAWVRRNGRLAVLAAVAMLVVVAGGLWLALPRPAPAPAPKPVSLSVAMDAVTGADVASATVDQSAGAVVLKLKDGRTLTATYPDGYSGDLTDALLDHGVATRVAERKATGGASGVIGSLTSLVLVGALIYILVKMRGGVGGFKRKPVDVPTTRFADVAGCPEATADLAEIAALLVDPARFSAAGARTPRGYLLTGPPGTGKTLLARAVAGEAGVPFFATSGADFADMYVGTGKRRVRDLFAAARKAARNGRGAVVFLDEIDAVGRERGGARRDSATDERDATLVALLTEMDGFDGHAGIVVLAATNRPDALDSALTRPGRFDRQISVPAPDSAGRGAILAVHAARITLADDVDLLALGRRTPGLVGADLEALVNEAALEAGRRGLTAADAACFEEALATSALGRARVGTLVAERDRKITAWHEAGHAVLALVDPDAQDPMTVTIVPRGGSGGTTWMAGSDDAFLTREQALARLRVALAGRAGEELLLDGSYSQGAAGDLDGATKLAIAMATEFGMTRLGLARRPMVGADVPTDVLDVVNELLAAALDGARAALAAHRGMFGALVDRLLDAETVRSEELQALRSDHYGERTVEAAQRPAAAAPIPAQTSLTHPSPA